MGSLGYVEVLCLATGGGLLVFGILAGVVALMIRYLREERG